MALTEEDFRELRKARLIIMKNLAWGNTKQGSSYWSSVYNNLDDIITNGSNNPEDFV